MNTKNVSSAEGAAKPENFEIKGLGKAISNNFRRTFQSINTSEDAV